MLIIHKIQSLFLRRTSRNHWRMWAQKPIQISKRAARTNHSQAKPSNLVILRPLANPWRLASRPPRLHHRTSLDLHQAFHLLLIFLEGWNIFLQKTVKKSGIDHKDSKCLAAKKPNLKKISCGGKQNKEKPAKNIWAKKVEGARKTGRSENVDDIVNKVLKLDKRYNYFNYNYDHLIM